MSDLENTFSEGSNPKPKGKSEIDLQKKFFEHRFKPIEVLLRLLDGFEIDPIVVNRHIAQRNTGLAGAFGGKKLRVECLNVSPRLRTRFDVRDFYGQHVRVNGSIDVTTTFYEQLEGIKTGGSTGPGYSNQWSKPNGKFTTIKSEYESPLVSIHNNWVKAEEPLMHITVRGANALHSYRRHGQQYCIAEGGSEVFRKEITENNYEGQDIEKAVEAIIRSLGEVAKTKKAEMIPILEAVQLELDKLRNDPLAQPEPAPENG